MVGEPPRSSRTGAQAADRRTEAALRACAVGLLLLVVAMLAFVLEGAWPSFRENGLSFFFGGGETDRQISDLFNADPETGPFDFHALPLLYGTLLTTGFAVVAGLVVSVLSALFIVEFAPRRVGSAMHPIVRLLAAVPSVIWGLVGILVIAKIVSDLFVTQSLKESVIFVVQISGQNVLVASLILTMMIVPIMTAITVDALRAVPRSWIEGSLAVGVNRWRTWWRIGVRTARPAIIAGAVLATARALGEAIMLSMVSGSVSFSPNPLDGLLFFLEPVQPVAAAIATTRDGISTPLGPAIYALSAVLLVSTALLSLAAWAAKQPMKKYAGRV